MCIPSHYLSNLGFLHPVSFFYIPTGKNSPSSDFKLPSSSDAGLNPSGPADLKLRASRFHKTNTPSSRGSMWRTSLGTSRFKKGMFVALRNAVVAHLPCTTSARNVLNAIMPVRVSSSFPVELFGQVSMCWLESRGGRPSRFFSRRGG